MTLQRSLLKIQAEQARLLIFPFLPYDLWNLSELLKIWMSQLHFNFNLFMVFDGRIRFSSKLGRSFRKNVIEWKAKCTSLSNCPFRSINMSIFCWDDYSQMQICYGSHYGIGINHNIFSLWKPSLLLWFPFVKCPFV